MSESKKVKIITFAGGTKTFETAKGEGVSRGGKAEIDGEVVNIEVATGSDDREWLEGLTAPITLSGLLRDKGKYGFGLWASAKYNQGAKPERQAERQSPPSDQPAASNEPKAQRYTDFDKQASIESQAALDKAVQFVIAMCPGPAGEDFDERMVRVVRVAIQFRDFLAGKKKVNEDATTEQAKKDDFPF